jgi:hypothetical protein
LYAEASDALIGTASPVSFGERLRHAAHTLRANPAALWRLLPFIIVAAALPAVCAPLLMGMPAVPEPRCGPSPPLSLPHFWRGSCIVPLLCCLLTARECVDVSRSGPLEPGDADYVVGGDAAEGDSVGCVPPAGTSSRKPTRGKALQLKPKKT